MRTPKIMVAALFLAAPTFASIPAHPGMLNFVEGQANIDGRPVTNQSVGNVDVQQGQVIETGQGKAEVLLTPGVFLRLGINSAVRMVNNGLADTTVEILRGEALIEAANVLRGNNITVIDHGVSTRLDKNGIYGFKFDQAHVQVYQGEATVNNGDQHTNLTKGKDEDLTALHVTKFDVKQVDDLYRWSDLRAEYISEASASTARTVVVEPGFGAGWFWNPWYGYYTFLPGPGFLYSPFGWGYYGPRGLAYYHGPSRAAAASTVALAPRVALVRGGAGFRAGRR